VAINENPQKITAANACQDMMNSSISFSIYSPLPQKAKFSQKQNFHLTCGEYFVNSFV
jgi:hypothetical protein